MIIPMRSNTWFQGSYRINTSSLRPWAFLPFIILSLLMTTTQAQSQPLESVSNVDLKRYAGKWYEIASFPQRFQKGCHCTTAEYTLSDKGYVIVENRCNKGSVDGKPTYIKGKAFVQEGTGNAKLKVQFFWPFRGKYWIIDLADDYSYAVVSHPNRKYLWILSRTPKMSDSVYQKIIARLKEKGFDLAKLQITPQVGPELK
jgi:apolipoprotein D and lipocalin family protein